MAKAAVRVYFDLVFEPPLSLPDPMEPPEKVAARKLAKRILGYDPDAPPEKSWVTFDAEMVELSFNHPRLSFAKPGAALKNIGIDASVAAASAAKLQAHIEQELSNSLQVELDAAWPAKERSRKKDGG